MTGPDAVKAEAEAACSCWIASTLTVPATAAPTVATCKMCVGWAAVQVTDNRTYEPVVVVDVPAKAATEVRLSNEMVTGSVLVLPVTSVEWQPTDPAAINAESVVSTSQVVGSVAPAGHARACNVAPTTVNRRLYCAPATCVSDVVADATVASAAATRLTIRTSIVWSVLNPRTAR